MEAFSCASAGNELGETGTSCGRWEGEGRIGGRGADGGEGRGEGGVGRVAV